MRRPPPGYRRGTRPLYPGVFKMLIYGFVLWGLALLGIRLPIDLPRWLFLFLEIGVIWFLWRGVKAARPSALKRATRRETASPERRPTEEAAVW